MSKRVPVYGVGERELRKVAFEGRWEFQRTITGLASAECCICKARIQSSYHCFFVPMGKGHVHVHDRCMPDDLRVALALAGKAPR